MGGPDRSCDDRIWIASRLLSVPHRRAGGQNGPGFLQGGGREISALVPFLSSQVQRPVVDRTGLAGAWDIELTFNPDSPDDPRPSLFTALQEQLGLRLEPARAPVRMLVIDRIERPAAN